ncbi:MAG: nitronate monooxygenase [Rhodospirillales bacterium]|jgi:hypothetical protein|nr:nitronate monooxygenase [Rhodospirillales bacterium]
MVPKVRTSPCGATASASRPLSVGQQRHVSGTIPPRSDKIADHLLPGGDGIQVERPRSWLHRTPGGAQAMVSSRFTRLVRCALPLQQAGMGANASPELGAAVPKADGLGRLGTSRGGMGRGVLKARPDQVKALPAQPFGVSFIAAPSHIDYPQQYARSGADVWRRSWFLRVARLVATFFGVAPDHSAAAQPRASALSEYPDRCRTTFPRTAAFATRSAALGSATKQSGDGAASPAL